MITTTWRIFWEASASWAARDDELATRDVVVPRLSSDAGAAVDATEQPATITGSPTARNSLRARWGAAATVRDEVRLLIDRLVAPPIDPRHPNAEPTRTAEARSCRSVAR
jgi:hypothetical protein